MGLSGRRLSGSVIEVRWLSSCARCPPGHEATCFLPARTSDRRWVLSSGLLVPFQAHQCRIGQRALQCFLDAPQKRRPGRRPGARHSCAEHLSGASGLSNSVKDARHPFPVVASTGRTSPSSSPYKQEQPVHNESLRNFVP